MKLIAILSIWIISFIFVLTVLGSLFIISPAFLGSTTTQIRFLIVHDDDVEILTISQIDEQFPNTRLRMKSIDVYVQYQPKTVGGPLRGWFELWETESFLDSEEFMFELPRIGVPRLTPNEITRAYQAILTYALADNTVSQYRPGQPPVTRFVPQRFLVSLIRILVLFGFPTLTAYIIHRLFLKHRAITIATRQKKQICIHCAYSCTDLPSPICPECGQSHTVQTESSVARLAEPPLGT